MTRSPPCSIPVTTLARSRSGGSADQLLREGGRTRVTKWVAGSARVERIAAAG